jgi:hypothetical protein
LAGGQFDGLLLQTPRTEHDGNRRHDNRERHPILDMNAKGVDPLDKHLHGRFPDFGRQTRTRKPENKSDFVRPPSLGRLSFENRSLIAWAVDLRADRLEGR